MKNFFSQRKDIILNNNILKNIFHVSVTRTFML